MPEIELGCFALVGFLECRAARILHVYPYPSLETPIGITLHTGCTFLGLLKYLLTHIIHTLRMLCFLRCIMYQSELIPLPTVPSLFHLVQCLRWFYKLLQVPAYSQIDTICQWWELRKLRMAGKSSLESSECLGSVGTITPAALAPIIARDCDTIPRTV